jgi:hypothetical protein
MSSATMAHRRQTSIPGVAAAVAFLAMSAASDCGAEEPTAPPDVPAAAGAFRSVAVETAARAAVRVLRTRGYEELGDPHRGFLVEGATLTLEAALRSDSCYVALLTSSEALIAATLTLHDSEGTAVARSGGVPAGDVALRLCPTHSGTYYLGVRADAGSGLVRVDLLSGPTGLDVRLDDLFGPSRASRLDGARLDPPRNEREGMGR